MRRNSALMMAAMFLCTFAASAFGACAPVHENQGGGTGNPPAEHTHDYGEWHTTTPATCTEDGQEQRECKAGDDVETRKIDKLGHDFATYVPDGNATCTEDGTETAKCTRCPETDTRPAVGGKLGHDYGTSYSADEHVHYFACSHCGDRKGEEPHTFVNDYECSVCHWHEDGTTSLTYDKNKDGSGYTVTGATNPALTKIVIPDTYRGEPVTAVAVDAFRVTEESIVNNIEEVVFGENVKSIGYCAFGYSTLKSVTIPDNVTSVGDFCFYQCENLKTVTVGDGDTALGKYSFQGCKLLDSFTVGDGNAVLGVDFIYDCPSLADFVIGNGDAVVQAYAFDSCPNLETVVFGDGDVRFERYAFWNCPKLKSIAVGDGDAVFETWSACYLTKLTDLTIGEGAFVIREAAFYGCDMLTDVTLGSNVCEIEGDAFYLCPAISYTVKDGVKYLGNEEHPYTVLVAAEDQGIASLEMSSDTKLILPWAFMGCDKLVSVTFGENVRKIGLRAFDGCALLEEAVLGDRVEEIGDSGFDGCKALQTVSFGSAMKKVGEFAFSGCSSIQRVNIPTLADWFEIEFVAKQFVRSTNPLSAKEAILYIDDSPVTEVTVPDGVTEIKSLAFADYTRLTSFTVGKDVESIGVSALIGCTGLAELALSANNQKYAISSNCIYEKETMTVALGYKDSRIPEGIRKIPAYMFQYTRLPAEFVIPDSVEEIGKWAFFGCETFTDLTLGTGLKTVGSWAFASSTASRSVFVTYHIKDLAKWCGVEFEDDGSIPLRWECAYIYAAPHAGDEEIMINGYEHPLAIPEGVEEIKAYAFWNIATQELHLPSTVSKIAPTAFGMNANLSSYEVAAGNSAYEVRDCGVVEKATNTLILGKVPVYAGEIGEGVDKIGDYAFSGKIYRNVSIASSVTEIGEHAFDTCRVETLKIGEQVRSIGAYAFNRNTDLHTVVIPAEVTFVGDYAFYQCGITDLTIGEKVQYIGSYAFSSNHELASVHLPASVTEIGESAFWCNGLAEATFDDTNWKVTDFLGQDVYVDFGDPAAVAEALRDSNNTWAKPAEE